MKQKRKNVFRLSGIIMAFLMTVTSCEMAFAATPRATSMKLEKAEGSVTLTTQNGTKRKISEGMRLYNGNILETKKSSYAYISLDSSKAVKLDASSKAVLKQNGKKLELLVKSGQLFFNVKKPLKKDESMNVRTSTMVTGIRGTCGIVEIVSTELSRLYLLEGKVSFGGKNPVTVVGGQIATVKMKTTVVKDITVENMKETDIPLFAIEEVVGDPVLKEKIEDTTELSVEKMEDYLEESKEETPGEPGTPSEPDTPSKPSTPSSPENPGGSGGTGSSDGPGSSGGSGSSTEPGGSGDSSVAQTTLTEKKISAEKVTTAFQTYDKVTVAKGASLLLSGSAIVIEKGKQLVIEAVAEASLWPDSGIQILSEDGLKVSGMVISTGNITLGDENGAKGSMEVDSDARVVSEAVKVYQGSSITNNGIIDIGSMESAGAITNNSLIKLNKAYTNTGSGTYTDNGQGILISNQESALPAEKLMAVGTGSQSAKVKTQYYYADSLTETGQGYLSYSADVNQASTAARSAAQANTNVSPDYIESWEFQKSVSVPEGHTVTLTGSMLDLGINEITVQGTLICNDLVSVSGSGTAVIRMAGGNLELNRTNVDSSSATALILKNTNTTNGYVIDVVDTGTGGIKWNDMQLQIRSGAGIEFTIKGMENTNDVVSWKGAEGYVKLPDNSQICPSEDSCAISLSATETGN